MPKNIQSASLFLRVAAVLSGVAFAVHIYLHLGDYTAERGVVALVQIAGISSAFSAMVLLLLETARNTLERIFPRDRE